MHKAYYHNYTKYNAFKQAAFDNMGDGRANDTELKYIFNFLETHFNNGATKYVIEIDSLLYTCTSCQRYLQALKGYGNLYNKEIIPVFKSHKDVSNLKNSPFYLPNVEKMVKHQYSIAQKLDK